jgi:hypothetical protein
VDPGHVEIETSIAFVTDRIEGEKYAVELVLLDEAHYKQEESNHCSVGGLGSSVKYVLSEDRNLTLTHQVDSVNQLSPQRMFLVLRDCDSTFINQLFRTEAYLNLGVALTVEGFHLSSSHYFDLITFLIHLTVIVYLVVEVGRRNRHQEIAESLGDLGTRVSCMLRVHMFSLALFGINLARDILLGSRYGIFDTFNLLVNWAIECMLGLMLLSFSFGWKVTRPDPILPDEKGFLTLAQVFWLSLNYCCYNYSLSEGSLIGIVPLLFKDIAVIYALKGLIQTFKGLKRNSGIFYKRLLLITVVYWLFSNAAQMLSADFEVEAKVEFKRSFQHCSTTIALALTANLLILRNNPYEKVALSNQSFMEY